MRSADAATALAEQQKDAAIQSAAAEREHSELIRAQMLTALRPVLAFTLLTEPGSKYVMYLVNQSATALALEIRAFTRGESGEAKGTPLRLSQDILGPGQRAEVLASPLVVTKRDLGASAFYFSDDRRRFKTALDVTPNGTWSQKTEEIPAESE